MRPLRHCATIQGEGTAQCSSSQSLPHWEQFFMRSRWSQLILECTDWLLKVKHHQQPANPDVLADQHAELDNLRVGKLGPQLPEECVVKRVMIERHLLGKL